VIAKAPISSEPPITPAVSGSQFAYTYRERLDRARVAIFRQQRELQAKLDLIDSEMRAIDAYDAAKKGKTPSGRRDRRRV
jgi:hypothetical protein